LKQKGSAVQLNNIRNILKVHNNLIIRISCERHVSSVDYLHKRSIIIFYFLLWWFLLI